MTMVVRAAPPVETGVCYVKPAEDRLAGRALPWDRRAPARPVLSPVALPPAGGPTTHETPVEHQVSPKLGVLTVRQAPPCGRRHAPADVPRAQRRLPAAKTKSAASTNQL